MIFKDKLALLKRELEIAPGTPAIPAVAEANRQMGITPGPGESLGVQLARLLATLLSWASDSVALLPCHCSLPCV